MLWELAGNCHQPRSVAVIFGIVVFDNGDHGSRIGSQFDDEPFRDLVAIRKHCSQQRFSGRMLRSSSSCERIQTWHLPPELRYTRGMSFVLPLVVLAGRSYQNETDRVKQPVRHSQ